MGLYQYTHRSTSGKWECAQSVILLGENGSIVVHKYFAISSGSSNPDSFAVVDLVLPVFKQVTNILYTMVVSDCTHFSQRLFLHRVKLVHHIDVEWHRHS